MLKMAAMKNILIIGSGPFPNEEKPLSSAGAIRTMQFFRVLQPLSRVKLVLISGDNDEGEWRDDRTYEISRSSPHLIAKVKSVYDEGGPFDAVFGVNSFPAYVASLLIEGKTPFWADLNGWIMAEMQAQAHELDHDHYLQRGWDEERSVLLRADSFSTVSKAQRLATIGELAAIGRLTAHVFGMEFVHAIPNIPQDIPTIPMTSEKVLFRGVTVPNNAFVVAQVGGFNNWLDEQTLFLALEDAMKKDDGIFFVSTGGTISGVAESTFRRFEKMVNGSPLRSRCQFLGWLDPIYIPKVYEESDIGIMADKTCVETETGARNRLNEMMQFGLPIVTTEGSEIAEDIRKWSCGKVVKSGDPLVLAEAILELKSHPELRTAFREKAKEVLRTALLAEHVMKSVTLWVEQNTIPLLHEHRIKLDAKGVMSKIGPGFQYLKERGVKQFLKKAFQRKGEKKTV